MQILRHAIELEALKGGVLVPTMGALHAGHAALVAAARRCADAGERRRAVIVSVFVNPTQFNEKTDFERYPRTLDADAALCADAGADAVFAPEVEEIYPPGRPVWMPAGAELPPAAREPGLEDAHRPGHFAGVCAVCRRLFELARPREAVFGEKDWQQLAVVRAMAASMPEGPRIIGHPTVREEDGLAMSSRNRLLTPNHRRRAAALARALEEAGRHDVPEEAEQGGRRVLLAMRIVPEYLAVRDGSTLAPLTGKAGAAPGARVLVAARVGDVRLIDNAPWPGFRIEHSPAASARAGSAAP